MSMEPTNLTRARTACGHGAKYKLGKGGFKPTLPHPWSTDEKLCDCSGFVAWCGGYARGPFNTDEIMRDSRRKPSARKRYAPVAPGDERPGDVVVYPSKWRKDGSRIPGHTGVMAQVVRSAAVDFARSTVIHCSSGNSRRGDAVQLTSASVFATAKTIFVRPLPTQETP